MLDSSIIFAFLLVNLLIGYFSGKKISNFSEYSVWKRSFNSFALCATLTASFVGGGYTLGNAAKVYQIGLIYAVGLLGFSLKEFLVAQFIAPKMQAYQDCHSVGDMMGKHYGRRIKIITGFFSVLICMGILGAQVSAINALFMTFFHFNAVAGIILGFGVIIVYASLGGMRSVVYTDVLQFLVLIVGLPLTFFLGLHYVGGWEQIAHVLPTHQLNPFADGKQIIMLFGLMLTFMLGEVLVPPYVQRLFLAKTHVTRRATSYAAVISAPIFIFTGATGLVAYVMNPHLDPNLAIPYVIQVAMPIGIKGLVIASLLAVIMSSAAGFLNAAAISFTNDIAMELFDKHAFSQKFLLNLVRAVAFVVGIGAIVFALLIHNILDILIFAYSLWSPVILVPLLAGLFGQKVNQGDFYFCASAGIITTLVWLIVLPEETLVSANVIGVFASALMYVIKRLSIQKNRNPSSFNEASL